jgi:hypothetical protein
MVKEAAPRSGFFSRQEIDRVLATRALKHTPHLRDVIRFVGI